MINGAPSCEELEFLPTGTVLQELIEWDREGGSPAEGGEEDFENAAMSRKDEGEVRSLGR